MLWSPHHHTANPTAAIIELQKVNKLSVWMILARLPVVCFVYLSCFLKHSKESEWSLKYWGFEADFQNWFELYIRKLIHCAVNSYWSWTVPLTSNWIFVPVVNTILNYATFFGLLARQTVKMKRENNHWCFQKYFSWINIKSQFKLWSEFFWVFSTSRKLPTFHSTCQLPFYFQLPSLSGLEICFPDWATCYWAIVKYVWKMKALWSNFW